MDEVGKFAPTPPGPNGSDPAGQPAAPKPAGTVAMARAAGRTGLTSYTGEDITILKGLDGVRRRPGMYIGSTGVRGLHHLVVEVVDNSIDEALAGYADRIDVTIHADNSVTASFKRGTEVTSQPDPQVFDETTEFDYDTIARRLRELSYLNKGVEIRLKDERTGVSDTFKAAGGIKDFVKALTAGKDSLHRVIHIEKEGDGREVEVAMQWSATFTESIYSFA